MSRQLLIQAEPTSASCYVPERVPGFDVVTVAGTPGREAADAVRVVLGSEAPADAAAACWSIAGQRVVAGKLTHTGPWPAADELYDLPLVDHGIVLVVGDADRAANVAGALTMRGVEDVVVSPVLRRADLERADVVIAVSDARVALVTVAMPTLAARRILIAPAGDRPFGLLPGIDHYAYESDAEAVQFGDAAASWESFDMLRAAGAEAAVGHRASDVYQRIAGDMAKHRAPSVRP